MKKGFTLVEVIMATAILAMLTVSVVPFIIQSNRSQKEKIEMHDKFIEEFSDINDAMGSKTTAELLSKDTSNIRIEKVADYQSLYRIEGEETGVISYIRVGN